MATVNQAITSKGSIALRAGLTNARRCFGRYNNPLTHKENEDEAQP